MTGTVHEVSYIWEDLRLAGSLHLPDGEPPFPAVLMLQGSGPSERDNDVYFPPLRDELLRRGLAACSFDKPGTGESEGDWRDYGLEGRAAQAIAALDLLQARPEIDAERIGVLGHSQGGWLVQMLAARLPHLAFAITSSGPSISVEEQNLYGCEHTMRAKGHSDAHIEQALEFLRQVHDAAREGEVFESVDRRLLAPARAQPWYGYLEIDDAAAWELMLRFTQEGFEPLEALSNITCPFLAVFGGLDPLVPAWRGAAEVGQTLQQAGNEDATVIVFAGGNHRMQDADDAFVSGYLDLLGTWAARRAGLSG